MVVQSIGESFSGCPGTPSGTDQTRHLHGRCGAWLLRGEGPGGLHTDLASGWAACAN